MIARKERFLLDNKAAPAADGLRQRRRENREPLAAQVAFGNDEGIGPDLRQMPARLRGAGCLILRCQSPRDTEAARLAPDAAAVQPLCANMATATRISATMPRRGLRGAVQKVSRSAMISCANGCALVAGASNGGSRQAGFRAVTCARGAGLATMPPRTTPCAKTCAFGCCGSCRRTPR